MLDLIQSRFALSHPQRTYESIISLMNKYPWAFTRFYTIGERFLVFDTAHRMLSQLCREIFGGREPSSSLTSQLLQELLTAGLKCSGFSESQKAELIDATEYRVKVEVYVPGIARIWPFEALCFRPGASEQLLAVDIILHMFLS